MYVEERVVTGDSLESLNETIEGRGRYGYPFKSIKFYIELKEVKRGRGTIGFGEISEYLVRGRTRGTQTVDKTGSSGSLEELYISSRLTRLEPGREVEVNGMKEEKRPRTTRSVWSGVIREVVLLKEMGDLRTLHVKKRRT